MRRSLTLLAVLLTSCGPIQSAQVEDQINGMVGFSKEHVLSCMGPPSSTSEVAATEVWSYSTLGPIRSAAVVSGDQRFAVGTVSTSQDYCVVNLTIRDGAVVAASYRSHGRPLSPSLPCYYMLHACVPDPAAARAKSPSNATREATAFCRGLYKDPRLNPLRDLVSLDEPPTLKMQSIDAMVTDDQRAALNVLQTVRDQCRTRIAAANPKLWKLMVQLEPSPNEKLKELYDRKITIGQYNSDRQLLLDKFQTALVSSGSPQRRLSYCYEAAADRLYTSTLTQCVGSDVQLTKEQYETQLAAQRNGAGSSPKAVQAAVTDPGAPVPRVPLRKHNGVLVVPVLINNSITLDFVLDTGAADVSIPADVVSTLIRAGAISSSDFLGSKKYELADGTVVPSQTFRIKSLKVADKVVENVTGSVAPANGTLLLGQSFLGRFKSWRIDNSRQALVLE